MPMPSAAAAASNCASDVPRAAAGIGEFQRSAVGAPRRPLKLSTNSVVSSVGAAKWNSTSP